MQVKFKKSAQLLGAIVIINSPLKMFAQYNNQWCSWDSQVNLPVKEGLSNTVMQK